MIPQCRPNMTSRLQNVPMTKPARAGWTLMSIRMIWATMLERTVMTGPTTSRPRMPQMRSVRMLEKNELTSAGSALERALCTLAIQTIKIAGRIVDE